MWHCMILAPPADAKKGFHFLEGGHLGRKIFIFTLDDLFWLRAQWRQRGGAVVVILP